MEGFTKQEVQEATRAREAYRMVGNPSEADYTNMVRLNLLKKQPRHNQIDQKRSHYLWPRHTSPKREESEKVGATSGDKPATIAGGTGENGP